MRARRFYLASVAAVVLVAAACSGMATAPSDQTQQTVEAPQLGLLDGLTGTIKGILLQCSPLPASSNSVSVGPEGGVVTVGPHVLVIPPGALTQRTTIRGDVVSGNVNSVRFYPEGLKFRKSTLLTMSYRNCSGLGMLLPKKIVYTDEGLHLLQILLSLDLSGQKLVSAPVDHFSRYAIAY